MILRENRKVNKIYVKPLDFMIRWLLSWRNDIMEVEILSTEYKIEGEFRARGKRLYVVRIGNNAHIMDDEDIRRMEGNRTLRRQNKSA